MAPYEAVVILDERRTDAIAYKEHVHILRADCVNGQVTANLTKLLTPEECDKSIKDAQLYIEALTIAIAAIQRHL